MQANTFLRNFRFGGFEVLLDAYRQAGCTFRNAIDGGAGSGSTSASICKHLDPAGTVHAFEPFPGNHRFFEGADPRIRLHPLALSSHAHTAEFRVDRTVPSDSKWGGGGMQGYSSSGYLVEAKTEAALRETTSLLAVDCVAANDVVLEPVDFIKLDLQGAELVALKGMARSMYQCQFMWVEYTGQKGLASFLSEQGFILFDTVYFIMYPKPEARAKFAITGEAALSSGHKAFHGVPRGPWPAGDDYEASFMHTRNLCNNLWTDLVCVKRDKLDRFMAALDRVPLRFQQSPTA